MHRSGTSGVGAILDALGVNLGEPDDLLLANEANLAGYFENKHVLEVNDRLLAANSLNWRTLPAVDARKKLEGLKDYLPAIEGLARQLGGREPWGVKDPRLSFLLPYWKPLAPASSAIICVRRPEAVALSMLTRNEINLAYGAALWELYTLAALRNTRRMPRVVMIYEELLRDPEAGVRRLVAGLPELAALNLSDERIRAAAARIQADLDHSENGMPPLDFLSEGQSDLYRRLASGSLAVSKAADAAPIARELVRLEAGHQAAKAAAARAAAEAQAQAQRADETGSAHRQLVGRLVDLIGAMSGQPPAQNAEAVFAAVAQLLRARAEPPAGYVDARAVDEIRALKDERIEWFRNELAVASQRAAAGLDQLQEARLELIGVRAELQRAASRADESDRVAAETEDAARQLARDLALAREELRAVQLDRHAIGLRCGQVESELAAAAMALRDAGERGAAQARELVAAQERQVFAESETRQLRAVETELRSALARAGERQAELSRQLADLERAQLAMPAVLGELRGQLAEAQSHLRAAAADREARAGLEQELEQARAAVAEARQKVAAAEAESAAASAQLAGLAPRFDQLSESHAEDQARLAAVAAELKQTVADRDAALAREADALARIDAISQRFQALAEERDAALEREQAALAALPDANAAATALHDSLAASQARAAGLEAQLAAAREAVAEADARIAELTAALETAATTRQSAAAADVEMAAVRAELDVARGRIAALEAEAARRPDAPAGPRRDNDERDAQLRNAQRTIAANAIALKNATQLIDSLEKEVAELGARVDAQQAALDAAAETAAPSPAISSPAADAGATGAEIELLRKERDGLARTLEAARKAQRAAEVTHQHGANGAADRSAAGDALARRQRQLNAMAAEAEAIHELLNPPIGGRFNVPVRKIRQRLHHLRLLLDSERVLAKAPRPSSPAS
jgi:hypothetical protein